MFYPCSPEESRRSSVSCLPILGAVSPGLLPGGRGAMTDSRTENTLCVDGVPKGEVSE